MRAPVPRGTGALRVQLLARCRSSGRPLRPLGRHGDALRRPRAPSPVCLGPARIPTGATGLRWGDSAAERSRHGSPCTHKPAGQTRRRRPVPGTRGGERVGVSSSGHAAWRPATSERCAATDWEITGPRLPRDSRGCGSAYAAVAAASRRRRRPERRVPGGPPGSISRARPSRG